MLGRPCRETKMKVFWSWQDDLPRKTNRHLIKDALEMAVAKIAGDYEINDADRPELDHDTKGIPGAVEIAPVVLKKITESAVFVADVTPVATTGNGKPLPNANVMVELGYSLHTPGEKRQIYVMNTASGFEQADLPFDIRGRRTLHYALADDADAAARARAKESLARDLAGAIRTNLADAREEQAQNLEIAGVDPDPSDFSVWKGIRFGFKHHDSSSGSHWREVQFDFKPRIFMRVIPSGWRNEAPAATTAAGWDGGTFPDASSHERSGDYGPTPDGYVKYWIGGEDPRTTSDLTMYFDKTGEFWMITAAPIYDQGLRKCVDIAQVFSQWARTLNRCHDILDHYGAYPHRRSEVGFAGFANVVLPLGWYSASQRPARTPEFQFNRRSGDWSPEARSRFLHSAMNKWNEKFGVPAMESAEVEKFITANDRERGRPRSWE